MDFTTAIKTVLTENYVNFQGRAQRSEFWWFALFVFVVSMLLSAFGDVLAGVFGLAVLLPGIAVAVRRLHDVDLVVPSGADPRAGVTDPDLRLFHLSRHDRREPFRTRSARRHAKSPSRVMTGRAG